MLPNCRVFLLRIKPILYPSYGHDKKTAKTGDRTAQSARRFPPFLRKPNRPLPRRVVNKEHRFVVGQLELALARAASYRYCKHSDVLSGVSRVCLVELNPRDSTQSSAGGKKKPPTNNNEYIVYYIIIILGLLPLIRV